MSTLRRACDGAAGGADLFTAKDFMVRGEIAVSGPEHPELEVVLLAWLLEFALAQGDANTPAWFELDGETLVFMTWHEAAKAKCLRRDLRVALCADDETPPYAYVLIEGTATLSDDPAALRNWATRIGGKYMGTGRAEEWSAAGATACPASCWSASRRPAFVRSRASPTNGRLAPS